MSFKFEKLIIWQRAMDLGERIHAVSKSFPKEELFNLVSQSRRAADSIALNIAEGSIAQSNPEQKKFIGYALRSLAEVVTCIHKANKRKYMDESVFTGLYQESFSLMNMITAFKNNIQ